MRLILATKNKGKVAELRSILEGYDIVTMTEVGFDDEIEENGLSFEENALIKARYISEKCGGACVADDSGLEVTALGMRPGVYSARYEKTDERRIAKLLDEMKSKEDRSARFVCAAALCLPDGREFVSRGEVYGQIIDEPLGHNGFGYDPVFKSDETGKTFAQMSEYEKNAVSHRRRAFEGLKKILSEIF